LTARKQHSAIVFFCDLNRQKLQNIIHISTIKYVIFVSRLLNSQNFGKYDTLSSKTCNREHSTLNGVCARFRDKAKIQNKIIRTVQRYNKQKGIELIHVQIKMKLNGLLIVTYSRSKRHFNENFVA
jgi:hypothetical protein